MELKNLAFECELDLGKTYTSTEVTKHSVPPGDWIVEGYASTSDLDAQNHIVAPEAMKMGADSLLKYNTVLFNHDVDRPIGVVRATEATDSGLLVKVAITKTEAKIWEQIKDGTLSKFSIRGHILDSEVYSDERTFKDILVIKAMELHEVSMVSVPANPHAKSLSWYIEKALKGNVDKPVTREEIKEIVVKTIVDELSKGVKQPVDKKDEVKKEDEKASDEKEVKKSDEKPADEKKDEKQEVKKSDEAKVEVDLSAFKNVIEQLQTMVKEVSTQSETVKSNVTDIAKAKDEVTKVKEEIEKSKTDFAKMLNDLSAVLKEIPIRKGQSPDKEEDRTKETVKVKKDITEDEVYKSARNPSDQLHMLINDVVKNENK